MTQNLRVNGVKVVLLYAPGKVQYQVGKRLPHAARGHLIPEYVSPLKCTRCSIPAWRWFIKDELSLV